MKTDYAVASMAVNRSTKKNYPTGAQDKNGKL